MARVVGIHGIGQQFKGAAVLVDEWEPSMRSGIELAGGQLDAGGLACAFYGDLFRTADGKAAGDRRLKARDVNDEWEREFLGALWEEAAAVDDRVSPPAEPQAKLRTPVFVQRALRELTRSRFFGQLAQHALIADLKQVRGYLHDDSVRQQVQARVEQVVAHDTQVLVGHSLGSIVAYEALCAHPDWPVRALVTLGSPLGIENLIFDRLRPTPKRGQGSWPGGVKSWVNVADEGDVVALRKDLDPIFTRTTTDILVNNGAKAHSISPYLTARETGAAILAGLAAD